MQKAKHRGISRVDSSRFRGWFSRISLKGKIVQQKLFSDGKFGGEEQSLQAAINWRDEWYEVLAIQRKDYRARPRKLYLKKPSRPNLTSGRVGVFSYWKNAKGNKNYGYFVAHYTPVPGRRRKEKSFSIARHGHQEALELACRQRELWEQELDRED